MVKQKPFRLGFGISIFSSFVFRPEVTGILELGNVGVFVQLFFGPHLPMNQLNKNPNISQLQDS